MKKIIFILLMLPTISFAQSVEAKKALNDANKLYNNKDYKGAIQAYQKVINMDKTWIKPRRYKAQAEFAADKFTECITTLNGLLKIDGKNPEHYDLRAKCHHQLFMFLEAVTDVEIAISLNPKYAPAYATQGFIRLELDDYKSALESYNKAIELDPNYGKAYYERGLTHHKLKDEGSSCVDWEKASSLGFRYADQKINQYCDF